MRCLFPAPPKTNIEAKVHTWTGASIDQQRSSPSGKLLHCTPEFNEPLRGSPSGLPTFSFLSEKCGVRAHFYKQSCIPLLTLSLILCPPYVFQAFLMGFDTPGSHMNFRDHQRQIKISDPKIHNFHHFCLDFCWASGKPQARIRLLSWLPEMFFLSHVHRNEVSVMKLVEHDALT